MTTTTTTTTTATQVYRVYIKATAAGYPCPDIVVDGEVIEADPPHKLVTTWRMLMDPTCAGEQRVRWRVPAPR